MREIWFAAMALLSLAGAAPAWAQAPATAPPAADSGKVLALTPDDRILGNKDAPVTIVEYASLTCPHCAHFTTEVLPKIKETWIDNGKAKLVLRDYPLDEPALRAAMVARCAPPAKFYPFIDTLFADQQQWGLAKDYKAALARLALLGGMSKTQFDDCLADKAGENKVLQSRLAATQQLGVNSTPTFFVNGVKFEGDPTVEAFGAALGRAAGS
ncbi:MAG TPA: DsbA family protein [Stellaceae bacterium]|nr:DsbA family protein [Stellaceae bacterium]